MSSQLKAPVAPDPKHGNWGSASIRVALVGDSTLDNLVWVGKDQWVAQQIAANVADCAVANLAADGFTSEDTLNGNKRVISVAMRERFGDAVPFDEDGVFRPLKALAELEPPPTHVVLSVGGNDVREILSDMGQLPRILQGFNANYPRIVEACLAVSPSVVTMLQYRPSFYMDGGGYGVYQAIDGGVPGGEDSVQKLNHLMETIYTPVLALAKQHGLAVLDLPRSFDIYDDSLYCHQIEPSAKGVALISRFVQAAIENPPPEGSSSLYLLQEGNITTESNTYEAPHNAWKIPHDPKLVPGQGAVPALDSKVQALVGMGFDRSTAEAALAAHQGDLQSAVSSLLGD